MRRQSGSLWFRALHYMSTLTRWLVQMAPDGTIVVAQALMQTHLLRGAQLALLGLSMYRTVCVLTHTGDGSSILECLARRRNVLRQAAHAFDFSNTRTRCRREELWSQCKFFCSTACTRDTVNAFATVSAKYATGEPRSSITVLRQRAVHRMPVLLH